MAQLCFICKRRAGGRGEGFPCYFCARAVGDAVVVRTVDWVQARFLITAEFEQARALALAGPRPRSAAEVEEYARTGVGLAAAYVGLGMQGAALVAAALAISWGASGTAGPMESAVGVVFSYDPLSVDGRRLLVEEFGWSST